MSSSDPQAAHAAEPGYALVTGAGQGIGRAIALELAARGHGIIAIARTSTALEEVVRLCNARNGGRSMALELDLLAPDAIDRIESVIDKAGVRLTVLVNNAGQAVWGRFDGLSMMDHRRVMELNMRVPLDLTHRLLPRLRANGSSYILNVGSMSGYTAIATLATYSGSKAFLLRWSRSLRMELRGSGVRVCCVCPGSVITGFTQRAGMQAMDDLARKFGISPERVARTAVRALFSGRAEVVPGFLDPIMAWALVNLPSGITERIASAIYLDRLPTIPADGAGKAPS